MGKRSKERKNRYTEWLGRMNSGKKITHTCVHVQAINSGKAKTEMKRKTSQFELE